MKIRIYRIELDADQARLLKLAARWAVHAARQWQQQPLPEYDPDSGHFVRPEGTEYDPIQQAAGFALQGAARRLLRQIERRQPRRGEPGGLFPPVSDGPVTLTLPREDAASAVQMVFVLLRQQQRFIRDQYGDATYGPDDFREITRPWKTLARRLDV